MNLPNKLTVLRVVLIPFMMFFYLATFIPFGIGKILALLIFIVAAVTDLFDGKIARKYNMVTSFGKFLDPIADKILTTTVFVLIIADGTILNPYGAIIVSIILAREFIVSALRLVASTNGTILAADIWGKAKTMTQMIALPFCMFLAFLVEISAVAWLVLAVKIIAYVGLVAATILTIVSGVNYLIKNKDCFKEVK